ncbi:MAG: hypothetical protein JSS97_14640 [Actinobacteria bacterium]|nr:hypothetical protein [Actinomycetota bacterium]
MKEHLLSSSDRAALQSLIPLAGAVGAGTIFSLFAGNRRGAGLRVFEVFAIVAVLTAAASTAAISIDLLHANQAISDRDLTQTAMPLIIGTLLLVVVSVFNRINESLNRLLVLLPFVSVAVFAAAALVISSWSIGPGAALWVVMAIFFAGLALSGIGWLVDRRMRHSDRRFEQRRLVRLARLGYVPTRIDLKATLPSVQDSSVDLLGWMKGDSTLLTYADAAFLRNLTKERWDALSDGRASTAVGSLILLDVDLQGLIRRGRGPGRLRITLLRTGPKADSEAIEIVGNDDRLFDVSGLVA